MLEKIEKDSDFTAAKDCSGVKVSRRVPSKIWEMELTNFRDLDFSSKEVQAWNGQKLKEKSSDSEGRSKAKDKFLKNRLKIEFSRF